jgi:hypothetical protein
MAPPIVVVEQRILLSIIGDVFFANFEGGAKCRTNRKTRAPFLAVLTLRTKPTARSIRARQRTVITNINAVPTITRSMEGNGNASVQGTSKHIRFARDALQKGG